MMKKIKRATRAIVIAVAFGVLAIGVLHFLLFLAHHLGLWQEGIYVAWLLATLWASERHVFPFIRRLNVEPPGDEASFFDWLRWDLKRGKTDRVIDWLLNEVECEAENGRRRQREINAALTNQKTAIESLGAHNNALVEAVNRHTDDLVKLDRDIQRLADCDTEVRELIRDAENAITLLEARIREPQERDERGRWKRKPITADLPTQYVHCNLDFDGTKIAERVRELLATPQSNQDVITLREFDAEPEPA